jgi:hypothetical protein
VHKLLRHYGVRVGGSPKNASYLLCVAAPQCAYAPFIVCEHAAECCAKVLVQLHHLFMYRTKPAAAAAAAAAVSSEQQLHMQTDDALHQ